MKLQITGEKGLLKATMTPQLLPIVRSLEGYRKWIVGKGLSFVASAHNIRILEAGITGLEIDRDTPAPVADEFAPLPIVRTYTPKKTPMPHQEEAARRLASRDVFGFFMEQGTGKSYVALRWVGELVSSEKISGVLVIAPRGVHRQWVDEQIPTHFSLPYAAAYWEGTIRAKRHGFPDALKPGGGVKFYTINYDALKGKEGYAMAEAFVAAHGKRVAVILDESHAIKDTASQRWRVCHNLAKGVRHRMILTGTPIAKDLIDEWSQLKWLDESIIGTKFKTAFKAEFCILGGWTGDEIVNYKNVDRFRSLTDPHTYRVTKADLGFPEPLRDRWHFDMTPGQQKMIREIRQTLLTSINNQSITAANAAVSIMRMQQISCGFSKDENENIQSIFANPKDNPRVAALLDLIESTDDRKIIIWSRFVEDLRTLRELFKGESVVYGGSDNERAEAKAAFLSDAPTSPRFFLGNPQSGGVGLNLQGACRRAIYFSNSDSAIDRWQSEARIHRIGMTGLVTLTDLVAARNGLDKKILARLETKKLISDMAIGEIKDFLDAQWDD